MTPLFKGSGTRYGTTHTHRQPCYCLDCFRQLFPDPPLRTLMLIPSATATAQTLNSVSIAALSFCVRIGTAPTKAGTTALASVSGTEWDTSALGELAFNRVFRWALIRRPDSTVTGLSTRFCCDALALQASQAATFREQKTQPSGTFPTILGGVKPPGRKRDLKNLREFENRQ